MNKELCGTAPFTVHAFSVFTVWTVRNSTKFSGSFSLPPIKNPITIYLGHIHVKWILKFATEISLAKQVYMQSKLGDTSVSYIVNAVKCKMIMMGQMMQSGEYGILFWYSSIEFLNHQMAPYVRLVSSYI